jgi:hypothetical protein
LFTITTLIALFILIVIYFYGNIFAYTHRSNQILLSNIEQSCCFYEKILPHNWTLKKRNDKYDPIDLPEIYKFIKFTPFVTGAEIVVIYFCIIKRISVIQSCSHDFFSVCCFILFVVVSFIYIGLFRWRFLSFPTKILNKNFIRKIIGYCKCYHQKLKELYQKRIFLNGLKKSK